jgi:flagellar hook-associated protein 3 FlgL
MMVETVQRNMHLNLQRLSRLHDQLSSGKAVSRPSEGAVIATRSMSLTAALSRNEQFEKNINDVMAWMTTTETAIGNVTDILQRVRELVIYGANRLHTQTELDAIALEVDQLTDHLVEIANMEYNGRHIFGGFATIAAPYERDGDTFVYRGDNGRIIHEVSAFATVEANINGEVLFGNLHDGNLVRFGSEGPDIVERGTGVFYKLLEIRDAIRAGDVESLSISLLPEVDAIITNVLSQRSVLGARVNRMEAGRQRFMMEGLNIRELRSKIEDIDFARQLTEFKMQESIYEASLATAARVITPTLLQFLR